MADPAGSVGEGGRRTNAPELTAFAQFELETREHSYPERIKAKRMTVDEAGRSLAAWRALVQLLATGEAPVEACFGDSPAAAWSAIVEAVEAGAAYRLAKAEADPSQEHWQRAWALSHIARIVRRSAVRRLADLKPQQRRKAA